MIPVRLQPEPENFNAKVRSKGLTWLQCKGYPLVGELPKNAAPRPYWRDCLDELYAAYSGVCAYLAVYFERATGGASVDHLIPKSKQAESIYEWSNYRLASLHVNARKKDHEGILDPIGIDPETFHLELVTGSIYPNPNLGAEERNKAMDTIRILGLDLPVCREMRARHFSEYLAGGLSKDFFRRHSPFVHGEARRQGLLTSTP